jgi:hypothetical protein
MNATGAFYCVKCNKLEDRDQAGMLFLTGYFRVIHPLGFCVCCCAEEIAAADQLSSVSKEMAASSEKPFYDDYPFKIDIDPITPAEDQDKELVPAFTI